MIFKDYYRILELKTNRVTPEEIKTAYRELAKKYHPDVNIQNKAAEERFKDINEAYRVLTDNTSKRKYDKMWTNYIGNKKRKEFEESKRSSDSVFSDFFNMFFGNVKEEKETQKIKNKKPPIKGENIETEIKVSIEDAFYGLSKKISLRTVNGNMKTFSVKVPSGIRNSEKIRLIGQGKEGENGGKNGDLFIKINIEDNTKFRLEGCDLHTNLFLTPWEAALGTKTQIDSIDESVALYIPPGIQSGEQVKIAQKGYKDGKGGRGNLVAEVKIMVPTDLNDNEKELFKKMAEISTFNPRTM